MLTHYLWTRLALTPLVLGAVVALAQAPILQGWLEGLRSWIARRHMSLVAARRWWQTIFAQPYTWLGIMLGRLTAPIAHTGLRQGLYLTLVIYAWVGWTLALVMGIDLLIGLVAGLVTIVVRLLLAVLAVVFVIAVAIGLLKAYLWDGSDMQRSYQQGRNLWSGAEEDPRPRMMGTLRPGTRVNRETGRVQREGLLDWRDTDERIDPETGKIQKEGIFTWKDTGQRLDPKTGKLQDEGFFGWKDTGKRIDPKTGKVQEEGLLGWKDTGKRVDPKTGKHQKEGLWGWVDD